MVHFISCTLELYIQTTKSIRTICWVKVCFCFYRYTHDLILHGKNCEDNTLSRHLQEQRLDESVRINSVLCFGGILEQEVRGDHIVAMYELRSSWTEYKVKVGLWRRFLGIELLVFFSSVFSRVFCFLLQRSKQKNRMLL